MASEHDYQAQYEIEILLFFTLRIISEMLEQLNRFDAYIIDDNLVSLFATQYTLEMHEGIDRAIACQDVRKALKLLMKGKDGMASGPDIVFLNSRLEELGVREFLDILLETGRPQRELHIYILVDHADSINSVLTGVHPSIKGILHRPLLSEDIDEIIVIGLT